MTPAPSPQQPRSIPNDWLGDVTAYPAASPAPATPPCRSAGLAVRGNLILADRDGDRRSRSAFRICPQTWTFQGARVILGDSRPVGQLVYSSTDGDIISICFRKDAQPPETEDFKETIRDEIGLVTWHNAGTSYVLAGPRPKPRSASSPWKSPPPSDGQGTTTTFHRPDAPQARDAPLRPGSGKSFRHARSSALRMPQDRKSREIILSTLPPEISGRSEKPFSDWFVSSMERISESSNENRPMAASSISPAGARAVSEALAISPPTVS